MFVLNELKVKCLQETQSPVAFFPSFYFEKWDIFNTWRFENLRHVCSFLWSALHQWDGSSTYKLVHAQRCLNLQGRRWQMICCCDFIIWASPALYNQPAGGGGSLSQLRCRALHTPSARTRTMWSVCSSPQGMQITESFDCRQLSVAAAVLQQLEVSGWRWEDGWPPAWIKGGRCGWRACEEHPHTQHHLFPLLSIGWWQKNNKAAFEQPGWQLRASSWTFSSVCVKLQIQDTMKDSSISVQDPRSQSTQSSSV